MKDGQAFVANETNNQRKLREVYGLYCSLQEVPGVVHFGHKSTSFLATLSRDQRASEGVREGGREGGWVGVCEQLLTDSALQTNLRHRDSEKN